MQNVSQTVLYCYLVSVTLNSDRILTFTDSFIMRVGIGYAELISALSLTASPWGGDSIQLQYSLK